MGRAAAATARTASLVLLYSLRFALAAPETAWGLRRMVLDAAPLPPLPQAPAAAVLQPPRTEKAVLLALYAPIRSTGTAARPAGSPPSWELSTLAGEWHRIYSGTRPDLGRALEFYDR